MALKLIIAFKNTLMSKDSKLDLMVVFSMNFRVYVPSASKHVPLVKGSNVVPSVISNRTVERNVRGKTGLYGMHPRFLPLRIRGENRASFSIVWG